MEDSLDNLSGLLDRTLAGDLDAFGEVVRRFQDMAFGCAYAVLGNFADAEDAAQEAFVTAYAKLADLRDLDSFPGWFRRLVLTACNRIARRPTLPTTTLEEAATEHSPDGDPVRQAEQAELQATVLAAVQSLSPGNRMATTLFYIDGYSINEVAAFLEVPSGTVKSRLHESRRQLKETMMDMVDQTLKTVRLPHDFAEIVVREVSSQQDLKRAAELLGWSSRNRPAHFQSPTDARRAGIYVVGNEGSVDGAGYFHESSLTIGSTVLRTVRPLEMGGEAEGVPHPAFVKGFQAGFRLAREKGIHLSAVHGSQFDHAFCGFVPCFYYAVATLPCERAKSLETRATVRAIRDRKEEKVGEDIIKRDPYLPKLSAFLGGGRLHVVEEDGKPTGYFRMDLEAHIAARKYGMPHGHVSDITVRTRDAALAVTKRAADLTEKAGDKEIHVLQSHQTLITQTMLRVGGRYLLRPSCDLVGLDAEMVAIIDLVGLSQELQGEFQSRLDTSFAHDATGRFSIEIAGRTVGFVVTSGHVEIVARKQRVHRVLPRWVATRLYMGYYSGKDVLTMGPLPCDRSDGKKPDDPGLDMKGLHLPENQAGLFKALFPKLWPTSWPDPDVWPWVVGKEHPRYQGEEKKTPAMKAQIDALRLPWIAY